MLLIKPKLSVCKTDMLLLYSLQFRDFLFSRIVVPNKQLHTYGFSICFIIKGIGSPSNFDENFLRLSLRETSERKRSATWGMFKEIQSSNCSYGNTTRAWWEIGWKHIQSQNMQGPVLLGYWQDAKTSLVVTHVDQR